MTVRDSMITRCNENYADLEREVEEKNKIINESKLKYDALIKDTGKKLSSELSQNETKVENINAKCRPSTIHEDYAALSFQTASNVKKEICPGLPGNAPESFGKMFLNRVICSLFMVAASDIGDRYVKAIKNIQDVLKQPLRAAQDTEVEHEHPHVDAMHDAVVKHFRAHTISVDQIIEDILDKTLQDVDLILANNEHHDELNGMSSILREATKPDSSHDWSTAWRSFVVHVCQLAWDMAIQKPPMTFNTPDIGSPLNDDTKGVVPIPGMKFDQLGEMVIDYYLEPNLVHGDNVLESGRKVPCVALVNNDSNGTLGESRHPTDLSNI